MSISGNYKLINRETKDKNQVYLEYGIWNFFVGKVPKQVKVCVHLDVEKMPTKESIVKELVLYINAFEGISKNFWKGIKNVKI